MRGEADIDRIIALLGAQAYLLGQQPSSFGTAVYAFLWQILNAPHAFELKDSSCSHGRLGRYTTGIEQQFFAEDPMYLARQNLNG